MNYKKQLEKFGYVKTEEKVAKRKTRVAGEHSKEDIDICLNCTRKKCNGNCYLIRKSKKRK